MNNLNLRTLANSCKAFDGQVVFWILPYVSMDQMTQQEALERVLPRIVYIHKQTGEETTREPKDHASAKKLALQMKVEVQSEWDETYQWTSTENVFVGVEPLTIDVEFHLTDDSPTYLRAFEMYWQNRNGSVADNYQLFKKLVGVSVANAWNKAYNETRETRGLASPEIQQGKPEGDDDPNG